MAKITKKILDQAKLLRLAKDLSYPTDNAALQLLAQALTHKSAGEFNNERLEFLGDVVLNFVISTELYQRFPQANEGMLTRARSQLVCGDTLAEIARSKRLGEHLTLGSCERRSGSYQRSSILADCLEAIIGALYCCEGLSAAATRISQWFAEQLDEINDLSSLSKDPKTQLQELMQAKGLALPSYAITKTSGSQHKQKFWVTCQIELLAEPISGFGITRRKAEQQAAQQALNILAEQQHD